VANRTEAQMRQLETARAKGHTPEAKAKRSASLKRVRSTPEAVARFVATVQSPEVRKKAAEARRVPMVVRFWQYVSPEPNSGCWLWLGSVHRFGYGQLRVDGKLRQATHLALEIAGKPRPAGAFALHSCDNPYCCNPDHLSWGTQSENMQGAARRGRVRNHTGACPIAEVRRAA
jgi:hypothetical protein